MLKYKCLNCNKEGISSNSVKNKYCSITCQHIFSFDKKYTRFLSNENNVFKTSVTTRKALSRRDGYKCNNCGICDWQGKILVLEVEHIDGNYLNHRSDNLILLCPNCHSQTPTYKAKNKGKGRESRRKQSALKT